MENGIYIVGVVIGFVEEPWQRNGKSGINREFGLARPYTDKWGQEKTEVTSISVPEERAVEFIRYGQEMHGKQVLLSVVPRARAGGRDGAWLSYFVPKEGSPPLVLQAGDKLKVAS